MIFCEEAIIKTNNDTTQWFLKPDTLSVWDEVEMCYVPRTSIKTYTNVKIWQMVSNVGDTISIYSVKGFRNKVYKMSLPEGIVFVRKEEQVAAYQFTPGYLWIRNDVKEHDKQILGGAVITLLSDYHNGY